MTDLDKVGFHCPECKTVRPPYGFVVGDTGPSLTGTRFTYVTIFCQAMVDQVQYKPEDAPNRECGCILSIGLVAGEVPGFGVSR